MNFFVLGVNHKTAPVHVRERFAVPEARLPEALGKLTSMDGVEEAMIVSTCNRVEIFARSKDRPAATCSACARVLRLQQRRVRTLHLRAPATGSGEARLSRGGQPGFDGGRRIADPGAGEGSLRHCARAGHDQFAARSTAHSRFCRRQEGPHRDHHRLIVGLHCIGRGGTGARRSSEA